MSDGLLTVIACTAFVLGMFYSGSETAFIAADRIRLRHLAGKGDRRAARALDLVGKPGYFLSAVLVGTNLAVIGCTSTVTAIATRHYGENGPLLFNEIIPKGLFLSYANRAALLAIGPLRILTRFLHPVVWMFSRAADALTRALPADEHSRRIDMTMEELLFHIGDSHDAGLLEPETTAMVDRAIALKELRPRDVMVALDDVVMLDADAPVDSYADVFAREGFSRMPVYRGERGHVVGVMSVHEYLTATDRETLRDGLREPYTVALETPIVDVLLRMREQGRHMAMVRDQSGLVVGMTTMEDILERFVGAIADEFH
jgi:CBS domain containing-hemolysin-like protein